MKVTYTRPSLDDLALILDHIDRHSPAGGRRVRERLRATIDLVAQHPGLGTQTDDPTIRRIAVTPFPYLVFFEVTPTAIVIHAVRHGARTLSVRTPRRS